MQKLRISLDAMIGRDTIICFDMDNIYIDIKGEHTTISITELEALEKTSTQLNNRYYWRLRYRDNGEQQQVKFRSNFTFWNKNFKQFHHRLQEINPAAIKTPFRWWNS